MSTWTFYTVGGSSLTVCPILTLNWSHSRIGTLWTSRTLCTDSGILNKRERTICTRKVVWELFRWTLWTNGTRMTVGAHCWSKTAISAWNRVFWVHRATGKRILRNIISHVIAVQPFATDLDIFRPFHFAAVIILTYGLQDTQYNPLPHPYCMSHWGSRLETGLDLDTSDQLDSSDS